ncbi:HTH_Tnp_Tc3_2 domain-containing protein [Trichonephila clavipes]|nr:HTH_Tnp_Tc3_2 domain-containing protein [Trichonephila clavipes]
MRNREPFRIKTPMIAYNFILSAFNLYITYRLATLANTIWHLRCRTSEIEYQQFTLKERGGVGWLILFEKFFSLLDTIFFVLRKKYSHISFLHVFHHVCMCLLSAWIINAASPGRQCQEYQETSDRANCRGQLALSERGERWLRGIVSSQRSQKLAQITTQLNDGASRTVSKRTVQRSLHHIGFGSRRPTRVPLLNARHQAARLVWARENRDWSVEDRKRVAWSDESRFRMPTGGREYGVRLMKPWILHARLEMYKGMVTQSWSGVFFRGTVWDLWCLYQPPSMQFGT